MKQTFSWAEISAAMDKVLGWTWGFYAARAVYEELKRSALKRSKKSK